jgi:hypothetical protein
MVALAAAAAAQFAHRLAAEALLIPARLAATRASTPAEAAMAMRLVATLALTPAAAAAAARIIVQPIKVATADPALSLFVIRLLLPQLILLYLLFLAPMGL